MKQEYHFTISRRDRIYLIAFVITLLSWELVKYIIPKNERATWQKNPDAVDEYMYSIKDSTIVYSGYRVIQRNKPRPEATEYELEEPETTPTPVSLMAASVEELRSIGLSAKAAFNVRKYIDAGGIIRDNQGLLKIYGMDSVQLSRASPYLLFPEHENESIAHKPFDTSKYETKYFQPVDLNLAISAELESLPGIGPVLADRIIKFRESLGGYFDIAQVKECYGLSPETFEKIKNSLTIITPPTQVNINEIDVASFSHPYLPRKFLKMIKAYKDQHGPFVDATGLRKVYPPDTMWCERILPYLRFE